jgi:serine/threonine-protein kinase
MLKKYRNVGRMIVLAMGAAASLSAQKVKTVIPLKNMPEQVAVNPLSNTIYVAVPNFGDKPFDYLTVIDGNSDTVVKDIEIPRVAYAIAVDPLQGLVYVGGTYEDKNGLSQSEVVVVREKTKAVVDTIHISSVEGEGIRGLAINPVNGNLYVVNGSDNELDTVHGHQIQNRIHFGGEPYGVAVNPLLGEVYVTLLDGNIIVIDEKTSKVTGTTAFGLSDAGIAVDLATGHVFTSDSSPGDSSAVGVLGRKGRLLATVQVGNTPLGIDVDPGTHLAFVVNSQDGTTTAIDEKTSKVAATLPVSGIFLAINPITQKVYVSAGNGGKSITVINEK